MNMRRVPKNISELVQYTPEELWVKVRGKRDALLRESDWTMVADAPLTSEQIKAYKNYRKALRDLPLTVNNPVNVIFPVTP